MSGLVLGSKDPHRSQVSPCPRNAPQQGAGTGTGQILRLPCTLAICCHLQNRQLPVAEGCSASTCSFSSTSVILITSVNSSRAFLLLQKETKERRAVWGVFGCREGQSSHPFPWVHLAAPFKEACVSL